MQGSDDERKCSILCRRILRDKPCYKRTFQNRTAHTHQHSRSAVASHDGILHYVLNLPWRGLDAPGGQGLLMEHFVSFLLPAHVLQLLQ